MHKEARVRFWVVFGVLILSVPFLSTSFYAIMANDDFDIGMAVRATYENTNHLFLFALK